jgi:enamine deaminase RidA (YjgF/YER057c/UK114 family)
MYDRRIAPQLGPRRKKGRNYRPSDGVFWPVAAPAAAGGWVRRRPVVACKWRRDARNKADPIAWIGCWTIKRGRNMAGTIEQKLAAQGVVLHEPASPVANYVGFVRTGNLLFVSGQVCVNPEGKLIAKGKLGAGVTVEQGNAAARGCAINLLAQIKAALGDLDKVVRVVRLGGFVNSAPDFLDGPKVLNGASDLMVAAFGDKGRHARTTVGVAALPSDAAVEVEGIFEVS